MVGRGPVPLVGSEAVEVGGLRAMARLEQFCILHTEFTARRAWRRPYPNR